MLQSYFNDMEMCVWPEVWKDAFGSRTEMCCLGPWRGNNKEWKGWRGAVKFVPSRVPFCLCCDKPKQERWGPLQERDSCPCLLSHAVFNIWP